MDTDATPTIAKAWIEEEHVLLDGAGVVWRLRVELQDGRTGIMVVGEAPAPKNRRRLWAQLIHRAAGAEGPYPRTDLESKAFAAAEEAPAGKRGRRPVRRARRLAALNALLAEAPELFTKEFGGQAGERWSADLFGLTWDDRNERAHRDRLGRVWSIHEAAQSYYGGVFARATCRWPEPPLDESPYSERPRHHVLFFGAGVIKSWAFSLPNEVKHGLDPKVVKKLQGAIMDGSINQAPPAGVPDLGSLLAELRVGFRHRDEAQAAFQALAGGERCERRVRHRLGRDVGPEPAECPLKKVEIVDRRVLRKESFSSVMQGGEVLLLRVEPQAVDRRRGRGRQKDMWLAVHVGKEHDIPAVSDLTHREATTALTSDDFRDHLPRLVGTRLNGDALDATEDSARSAFSRVVDEDDRRRHRAQELERSVEILALARLDDGSTAIRYRTRWPTPDPVLGAQPRPTEHVALVMPDGIDTYGIGPGGQREQGFNARATDPHQVLEAIDQLRTDPAAYGAEVEESRWRVEWVLKSLSAGFCDPAAADGAWQALTDMDQASCAVDAAWADLRRRRRVGPSEATG